MSLKMRERGGGPVAARRPLPAVASAWRLAPLPRTHGAGSPGPMRRATQSRKPPCSSMAGSAIFALLPGGPLSCGRRNRRRNRHAYRAGRMIARRYFDRHHNGRPQHATCNAQSATRSPPLGGRAPAARGGVDACRPAPETVPPRFPARVPATIRPILVVTYVRRRRNKALPTNVLVHMGAARRGVRAAPERNRRAAGRRK